MNSPRYPALYQVNTRVWMQLLAKQIGRPATLDDIPDTTLDEWANLGFDWIYFLGVWQTGTIGQTVSRANPEWLAEYRRILSDVCEEDICGSCFAITHYTGHTLLGSDPAILRLRDRLHQRSLKLMLDFVPNHTASDHPWVQTHPEFYVTGTEELLAQQPQNYCRITTPSDEKILAYGRDPYFAGWCDTLQLNYGNPDLQAAMINELQHIAQLCDGVRCDMAMLVLPEIFQRTWGITTQPFWQSATDHVRRQHPSFVFMAEVYWDLEWALQQQGFDYTYDKRLYDRLEIQQTRLVREHFWANLDYQQRSARFLENHDEHRAAAVFPPDVHPAAAILTYFCPGLRFFHQGQFEGYQHRIFIHLHRGPVEAIDTTLQAFYQRLLTCLRLPIVRQGYWQLADSLPAWDGNWTSDCIIAFHWQKGCDRLLVAVNYAPHQSQCYIKLPFEELAGQTIQLQDLMGTVQYNRSGDHLLAEGLYLDLPAWGYHVFTWQVMT
ncbi:alpha-amylase family glycosyl hydrolase [Pantanalinema rosaneae CENA516]|uniref:alpha-amylase family glycosyl hydrolase n=1 Tax=Pantanalinema rosaneae TaxID=1620701 RepID=UPI003D6FDF2C